MAPEQKDLNTWDVFISHASEDKEKFVRPLADALRKPCSFCWYDETTLRSEIAVAINR